jgi:hypothetical protein
MAEMKAQPERKLPMKSKEVERLPFKKGDTVQIKPEWQDQGDEQFKWVAVDDESQGRVTITPLNTGLSIPPLQTVSVDMLVPKREGQAR